MNKITPNLWFDHTAKEAVDFYVSVFKDAAIHDISYYPSEGLADFQKEFAGKELTIDFELLGQRFTAINAGPEFTFNESVSFMVACKDQEEIDYYWNALTGNGGEESMCGWCKDKYGLSWQIVPENMGEVMSAPGAFERMMQMHKLDIQKLRGEQ